MKRIALALVLAGCASTDASDDASPQGTEALPVAVPAEDPDPATLVTDMSAALLRARALDRPVVIDFWAPGSGACERMNTVTYSDPAVQRALAAWAYVRVDVTRATIAAEVFDVPEVPVQLAIAPDARMLARLDGHASPEEFVRWLDGAYASYESTRAPVQDR